MDIDIFHHFQIYPLGPWGINNLVTGQWKCLLLFLIFCLGVKFFQPVENGFRWVVSLIDNIIKETLGDNKHGPFCIMIFFFTLFSNLYGLIPHQFSFNSHIIVTMLWALMVFLYGLFHGLKKPKKFMNNFIPHGAPKGFILLITPIKIISFLLSPVTLGIRLFVNVLIGHVMLTIFESFGQGPLIAQIPSWLVLIALTFLELGVSLLQTYIFFIGSINLIKSCVK